MLIESRIRHTVAGLSADQLVQAIAHVQQAMRQTCAEFREPVMLYHVSKLPGTSLLYCIRTLGSHTDKTFFYNYATFELEVGGTEDH